MLQSAIHAAQQSGCAPVLVVLGAHAEQIALTIEADILYNKDWGEGMASSIRIAIGELEKYPAVGQVIIMVCDQPFVSTKLLNLLIDKQQQTGQHIVACSYNSAIGVPALFNRLLFAELLSLRGQEGARKILNAYAEHVAVIAFEKGGTDIDTLTDYEALIKNAVQSYHVFKLKNYAPRLSRHLTYIPLFIHVHAASKFKIGQFDV